MSETMFFSSLGAESCKIAEIKVFTLINPEEYGSKKRNISSISWSNKLMDRRDWQATFSCFLLITVLRLSLSK
jgi:hypothetical protein